MLTRSAGIPWKCKRQLSDLPAALRKPEVVSGATAMLGDAIKIRNVLRLAGVSSSKDLVVIIFGPLGQL